MPKRLSLFFTDWSFRKKLACILVLFSVIPSVMVNQLMMYTYEKEMIRSAAGTVHSVVEANNHVLRMMLGQMEDASSLMLNNEYYYNVFAGMKDYSTSELLGIERRFNTELARQFTTQKEVFQVYLYTPQWIFGKKDQMSVTGKGIEMSGFLEQAAGKGGQPCWITGYDYGEAIGSDYLKTKQSYAYRYPVTMVREMSFQYNYVAEYKRLPRELNPYLFVYILEEDIRDIYAGSIGYEGSIYGIANENGTVLSADSELFLPGTELPSPLRKLHGGSGFTTMEVDGLNYLICYDSISDLGWFSFSLIPMKTMMQNTVMQTRLIQLVFLFLCLALSGVIAFLLSFSISRPVGRLTEAARRVATGDFRADTPIPRGKDFKLLTQSFNHMEEEINRLIHENYEITIREKETQLMALSMQINPHFLYNTLHTINMLAIQNDDEETSELIVSLSEMLKYTFKNSTEKIPLADEIGWLKNYIHIMEKRYEDVFLTEIEIEAGLDGCLVPKFFLQPFVENAIIHGFGQMSQGGILRIHVTGASGKVRFVIEDNGKGMGLKEIERCMERQPLQTEKRNGIGAANVAGRLFLMYAETCELHVDSKEGEGTRVVIEIPFE